MTATDWDGTPWAGTVVAPAAPRPDSALVEGKAAIGVGVGFYGPNIRSLSSLSRSPLRVMREAQASYHSHPWIHTAEGVVTRKVGGLPWHLEDTAGKEYKESIPADVAAIRDLIEKPQAAVEGQRRMTRREMWKLTSRHLGLCNISHWYKDQVGGDGIPLAFLYINPARMFPVQTDTGRLVAWVLDPKDDEGNGGTPIELNEVITFYLDPPDWGNIGTGFYEAAITKARLSEMVDQYSGYVIGTGGRIPGIVSPKEGFISDEKFPIILNEFRNVNESPDAAKRTTVMQGPTDFVETGATPDEIELNDLSKLVRDDIFTIWGVPTSQAPLAVATGMNSGETKGYDEAILMQGPVHDRVEAIRETLQYQFLDGLGLGIQLIIDEPEFDDESPRYELALKAKEQPLLNKERREILGFEPFGDQRDDEVWLPSTLVVAYDATGKAPEPEPTPPGLVPFVGGPPAPETEPEAPLPGKADGRREFLGLRSSVETKWVPTTQSRMERVLDEQRKDVAAKLRAASADTVKANLKRPEYWFGTQREDERLARALRPTSIGIAESVTERVAEMLAPPKKADTFLERVARYIDKALGTRISGINQTTRDAIAKTIADGVADGLSPVQIADGIETLPAFDTARAEMVARTETMLAYNDAALTSYGEYGVTRVQAIDGDTDEQCAARNGRDFSVEDAFGIQDHPNGTLDWAPYFEAVPAKAEPEPIATARKVRMTRLAEGGWEIEEVAV